MSEGLQGFLEAFAFAGVVIGTAGGALSGWLGLPPLRTFIAALVLALCAGSVLYAVADIDAGGVLVMVIAGPLIAVLPCGAGFAVGRRLVRRGGDA